MQGAVLVSFHQEFGYKYPTTDFKESKPEILINRFVKHQSEDTKTNYIQSALLVPVSAVREKAQVVWEHTDSAKHTIQDNYHDLQYKSDCK